MAVSVQVSAQGPLCSVRIWPEVLAQCYSSWCCRAISAAPASSPPGWWLLQACAQVALMKAASWMVPLSLQQGLLTQQPQTLPHCVLPHAWVKQELLAQREWPCWLQGSRLTQCLWLNECMGWSAPPTSAASGPDLRQRCTLVGEVRLQALAQRSCSRCSMRAGWCGVWLRLLLLAALPHVEH